MKSFIPAGLALLVAAGWAAGQAPTNQLPPPAPGNQYPAAPALNGPPVLGPATAPGSPATPGLSQAVNGYPTGGSAVYFSADYLLWKVREGAVPASTTAVPVGVIPITSLN